MAKPDNKGKDIQKNFLALIPRHGGYIGLRSYQMAETVFNATIAFYNRFIDRHSHARDQMVQAPRSAKQNVAKGSVSLGTSKKTELKLIGVARTSFKKLLLDFQDFLRQQGLPVWGKDEGKAKEIRTLACRWDRSYSTYKAYLEATSLETANAVICLIHQTNYLLDQQLRALKKKFLREGGFTERLYRTRSQVRDQRKK